MLEHLPSKLGPVFNPKYHEERVGKRRRKGRRGRRKTQNKHWVLV